MKMTKTSEVDAVFNALRARASAVSSKLGRVKIVRCPLADKEHARSWRQWAHTAHHKDTVCVASTFGELMLPWQVGILAHEFGHVYAIQNRMRHSEEDADRIGSDVCDVKVLRKGEHNLEWAKLPQWLEEAIR